MKTDPRRGETAGPTLTIKTTWGDVWIAARGGRVVSCALPFQSPDPARAPASGPGPEGPRAGGLAFEILKSETSGAATAADRRALQAADRFVRDLLAGRAPPAPEVELPEATEFTREVWRALLRIPPGRTLSYGEVASKAGRPRAARAVGTACGANRIPLFIPCHRVVGSGGALGGFSSGLAWKTLLLSRESGAR